MARLVEGKISLPPDIFTFYFFLVSIVEHIYLIFDSHQMAMAVELREVRSCGFIERAGDTSDWTGFNW
jgi:hypothetical protein